MKIQIQSDTVANLAEISAGYQLRFRPSEDKNGRVLLIQPRNINAERTAVNFNEVLRFEPARNYSKALLKEGDVLFMGKGTAPFACAVYNMPTQSIAAGNFFILRPDEKRILPEYLAWMLNRKKIRETLLIASGAGVLMPVVRKKDLEDLKIPLPPLEMQKKIIELHRLMAEEKWLMRELAEQKELLIRGVCKKLTGESEHGENNE